MNKPNKRGNTPLHSAALKGNIEQVKIFLAAGADVNFRNSREKTPLMCAAERGLYVCVDALINAGADVNASDYDGNTILMRAIKNEWIECALLLVQAGADVNLQNRYHTSAIEVASQQEDVESIRMLIEAGADMKVSGTFALQYAAQNLNYICMKVLIESGAEVNGVNCDNRVLMDLANAVGSREYSCANAVKCTQLMFKSGVQVNRKDDWFLQNALENLLIELYRNRSRKDCETVAPMLFFAAGEKLHRKVEMEGDIPFSIVFDETIKRRRLLRFLPLNGRDFSLKHLCRKAIRKHLLQVDKHTNLFTRVTQLGLPEPLPEYLVYDMSLEKEYTFDEDDDDDDDDEEEEEVENDSDDEESDYGSSSDDCGDGDTFDSFSEDSNSDDNGDEDDNDNSSATDDDVDDDDN